jgi:sigma-B regulation protein RsbU (phosphoserine phosphatase)
MSTSDSSAPGIELRPTLAPAAQRLQGLVHELSVDFISILDLDQLLDRVAERLREVIDYTFFNLFLVDEKQGGLVWKKSIGYQPAEVAEYAVLPVDRSLASAAWREKQVINVGDVTQDERYLPIGTTGERPPRSEIAVPLLLVTEQKVVGVLTIESPEENYFQREHERALQLIGSHLATALEHARVYEELRQRTREMQTLIEIGHEITSILDLDRLLNHIAPLLDRVITYEFLLVGLIDPLREEFVWHVELGYGAEQQERETRTPVNRGIVGRAVRQRRTQIVNDVRKDPDYYVTENWRGQGQRAEIAVPLIFEGDVIGVIALESGTRKAFQEDHAHLLESVANNLSIAIANARLYQERLDRERQFEREILMARDVQRSMIPETAPHLRGFEFAARLEPALNLSGDFYDYLSLSDKRLGVMIGDVAGKGIRAAMGMAAARSIMRSVGRRGQGQGPSRVLRDANLRIHRDLGSQLLLTLVYALVDAETRTIQYCNAGHNPPFLISANGRWRALKTGGLLMGVFDKQQYKSETLHLERGDLILFYTDGLPEAHTPLPERQEIGEQRVIDFLLRHRHLRAQPLLDALTAWIQEFTRGAHQHDDLTLLVMRVL